MELGHVLRHTVLSPRLSPPHLSPVCAWEVQGPVNVTQGCHLMKRDQLDIPYEFSFFLDHSLIYLLLAGLGLHCFPWTFSRCSRQGLLSRCGVEASPMVASNGGARALGHAGCSSCSPQARSLQHMGLVTLQHVGSSQTGDRTHVSCNDRPILHHWTTREALSNSYPYSTNPISHIKTSIQENAHRSWK